MQPSDNDNELDKLIREAGEQYHAAGTSPDWEKMEGLLDKHMPVDKRRRRRVFLVLILLLLFTGSITYLFLQKKGNTESLPAKEKSAVNKPATPGPVQVADQTSMLASAADRETGRNSLPQTKTEQNQPGYASGRTSHPQNKSAGKTRLKTYPGEIAENNLPGGSPYAASSVDKNESGNIPLDSMPVVSVKDEIQVAKNELPAKTNSADPIPLQNKLPADEKYVAGSDKKIKPTEKSRHSFELTLIYAPELTTIHFSGFEKPGSNFGLLVGFPVAKNIIIQTGIVKSRKNYVARGSDFVLEYPLSANHTLNKVDGYCMMYEIPLNLKSTIRSGKKTTIFYTAGISSYFMTREFYTYHYSTVNGAYNKSENHTSQRNYWLSLATLGVGFEKAITNSINIGATPFMKIPFKGMGEGKLKMLSMGVNFSVCYTPSF